MVSFSADSVIAKAMDAYRVRLWLKGPRCPCGCKERVPWSAVSASGGAYVFVTRKHVRTPRRPYRGVCHEEESYIPETLEEFRSYLVERRHVLHTYSEMLRQRCYWKGEDWMLALFRNGHATRLWRTKSACAWLTPRIVFYLVQKGWLEAADIVLRWPTTPESFKDWELKALVPLKPRDAFQGFLDQPLLPVHRNWILNHPAMAERTRSIRAHKNWFSVFVWAGLVKSYMRQWQMNRVPLPEPHMENVSDLTNRLKTLIPLHPTCQHYKPMLSWVTFLSEKSPTILRRILKDVPVQQSQKVQWHADLVETVATTGRVALLHEALRAFSHCANMPVQKEKIWKWAEESTFATPRVTRTLMRMSEPVLGWAKSQGQGGLARKLLKSKAIVATLDAIAPWLSTRMSDDTFLNLATKTRSCLAVATAFRATPRFQVIQRRRKFRATVYLALFFRNHVRLAKARAVTRGDCPICWAPKILQSLHGDIRHGMCLPCIRRLKHKNMLDRCPVCRVSLREPEEEWPGARLEWYGEWH